MQSQWFVIHTLSGQEQKVKDSIEKRLKTEEMTEYIDEVLVPMERVAEVRNGKKTISTRKLYPGYIFIHCRLYDDEDNVVQKVWYFINGADGVIGFAGGKTPAPLKDAEIDRILNQVAESEGKEVPKVQYEVGEEVKITDGPFLNLSGRIDEIDAERGKLKISVSILGRCTPVELEDGHGERLTDED